MRKFLFLLPLALSLLCAVAAPEYKAVAQIPIGGEGGWDILMIDDAARRLYVSHASKVVVVDLEKNQVVGEIGDTPGVHAFVAVPELQRGFSSNGKENKSSVVDLKTLATLAKVDVGENPDAVAYDAKRGEVYVFNHTGNSATVIDAKSNKVVATIPLGGSPEFPAVDSAAGRVYINLEDKSEVAVIDTAKHAVTARWPLTPGEEPTGIALDAAHHRLFAACHNKMMTMIDTESGKVVANVPIGTGVDGCAFDDATQLAFASCGEGVVTIAKESSPNELSPAQTLQTQRGARTIALDPKTHRIYLPTADFQPPSSPNARPGIVPNTMRLLVYGPSETTE
ncbi:MAG: YncE family protein [Chthoniobacterales bacterium]